MLPFLRVTESPPWDGYVLVSLKDGLSPPSSFFPLRPLPSHQATGPSEPGRDLRKWLIFVMLHHFKLLSYTFSRFIIKIVILPIENTDQDTQVWRG